MIGKGIARFHAVLWPALLASAGLPLPTDLLVHGYLTLEGSKISKSGRTLDPVPLIRAFGADAVRFFLLRHVRTARDADFRLDRFVHAFNAELANGLGNLASRVFALVERATGGVVPEPGRERPSEVELREGALRVSQEVDEAIGRLSLDEAVAAVFRLVERANQYVVREAPWVLLRDGKTERAGAVLRALLETLRVVAEEIDPFLPGAGAALKARLRAPTQALTAAWNALPTGARAQPCSPGRRRARSRGDARSPAGLRAAGARYPRRLNT